MRGYPRENKTALNPYKTLQFFKIYLKFSHFSKKTENKICLHKRLAFVIFA